MARIVDSFFRILNFAVFACLATMVIMVFGNVVLRYGFNSGITVSEELSRWAFVWLTFIGAVIAMREHTHLGMDTLVSKLPVFGKKVCFVLSHLIMLGCALMFMSGSWDQTMVNLNVVAAGTKLSTGWFYGSGLFFSVLTFIILSYNLYEMLSGKLKDGELIQIRESEEELDDDKLAELQQEMEQELKKSKSSADGTKI